MIISSVGLKGGSGKTTIAINLAVYFSTLGESVVIVDADENENSIKWSAIRDSSINPVTVVGLKNPDALRNNINDLDNRYDYVIIDGTPALNDIANTIMLLSDISIFPVQDSPLDIWALETRFIPKYKEVSTLNKKLIGLILLNNVDSRRNFSKEIRDFSANCDIPMLDSVICDLKIYKDSIAYGLGVLETTHERAKHEILNLGKEIYSLLNR